MGISLFIEDQVHKRRYMGGVSELGFNRIFEQAENGTLISHVHPHADTMFNSSQLQLILRELDDISTKNAEFETEIESFRVLVREVIKNRGYLWFSGD